MSGTNPLLTPGITPLDQGLSPALPARPLGASPAQPPVGNFDYRRVTGAHIAQSMRGLSQDEMIRHRDVAGNELEAMARFAAMPNLTKGEVTDYVHNLVGAGSLSPVEATQLLRTMPESRGQMQQWARMMFSVLMHTSVHAHAAYPIEQYPAAGLGGPQGGAAPEGAPAEGDEGEAAADGSESPQEGA